MRFATFNHISLHDLTTMANGCIEDTINDFDFLQTLADQHCFMVPPWVLQASPGGSLRKVARLVYTVDGQLDKSRLLVSVARRLGATPNRFHSRLSF
jgi:hypothetical protein